MDLYGYELAVIALLITTILIRDIGVRIALVGLYTKTSRTFNLLINENRLLLWFNLKAPAVHLPSWQQGFVRPPVNGLRHYGSLTRGCSGSDVCVTCLPS